MARPTDNQLSSIELEQTATALRPERIMSQSIRARLGLLRAAPPEAVENVLLEALRHARPDEIGPLCRRLLETGRPGAAAAALRRLEKLDETVRAAMEDAATDLAAPIRAVLHEGDLRAVPGLIGLIERRKDAALAGDLVHLLTHERGMHARRAAEALLNMTMYWTGRRDDSAARTEALSDLDRAVAQALAATREHRRVEALIAAVMLSRKPGPWLRSILADEGDPAHFALRGVADEIGHPAVRSRVLRWIDSAHIGSALSRRLHQIESTAALEDVLRDGHLLRLESKRNAVARIDRPARLARALQQQHTWSRAMQAWRVDFIALLGTGPGAKAAALGTVASTDDPGARLRAVMGLAEMSNADADDRLEAFIDDEKPAIARIAARRVLGSTSEPAAKALAVMARSRHPAVARAGKARAARQRPDAFFEHWMTLGEPARLAAAHRHFTVCRRDFITGLRAALQADSRAAVLAGIALIRRMHLGSRFESPLTGLTFHADPRIAASAVMALGESGAHHAVPAVGAALHHDDARVQANAVEALMRLHAPETRDLVAFLIDSRHNRPRANAIVACLRRDRTSGDGERRLREMLRDGDPLHRVSAVWAARRSRSITLFDELCRMAEEDDVGVVRRRAGAAARAMGPAAAAT